MKLNTSMKHIKKAAKSLKISTNNLEIKMREEDYTTANTKDIIFLLQAFYIYI